MLKTRMDTWKNLVTGVGHVLRDKVTSWKIGSAPRLTDAELETMVRGDGIARKIAFKLPETALRTGVEVKVADDPDKGSRVQERLRDLSVLQSLEQGFSWARTFGGAAIVLGVNDGLTLDAPLGEGPLEWLEVLDKRDLEPEGETGTARRVFGAEFFRVVNPLDHSGTPLEEELRQAPKIHASRLVLLPGAKTSRTQRRRNGGWDDSVVLAAYNALQGWQNVYQSSSHLVADASQGVFKIKGLRQMLSAQGKQTIANRLELMDQSRSVARAILLDEGEEFARKATNFAGLPDLLEKTMLYVAAVADMPVTAIFGRAPAGLNATGESDIRTWYDAVDAWRQQDPREALERIVELIVRDVDSDVTDESWSLEFKSLWQRTQTEEIEARKLQAEVDKVYLDAQVLDADEVAESRFRDTGYSFETQRMPGDGRDLAAEADRIVAEQGREAADPDPEGKPEPGEPGEAEAKSQETALNGAQVQALAKLAQNVSEGVYPRETGIQIALVSFPINETTARAIFAPIEEPDEEPAPPPPPTEGPPSESDPDQGQGGPEPPQPEPGPEDPEDPEGGSA